MNKEHTKDRLLIIGASGHGKVVADIAKLVGYREILFFDDNEQIANCGKYPVTGNTDKAIEIAGDIFIAVGNATIRKRIMSKFSERSIPVLCHPNAVIAEDVTIEKGTVIMPGVVINSGTQIGRGCIVNTCASVDHDCSIDEFCHIAVGAHLCGTVNVGKNTWIGAGSIVSNNIDICDDCMIGAGAVVINNIVTKGTYVGVPAKKIG